MEIETELMKELRSLRKETHLILRRQDMLLKSFVPEARPTMQELATIRRRKRFGTERDLFKALR